MLEGRRYASPAEDGRAAAPQDPGRVRRQLPARARPQAPRRAPLAAVRPAQGRLSDPRPARRRQSHICPWDWRWKPSPAATSSATPPSMTSSANCAKPTRSGRSRNKLAHYQRPHVLVVDEVGYLTLDHADANRFFQLINRRYTRSLHDRHQQQARVEWADTVRRRSRSPPRSSTASSTTPKSSRSTARATDSRADSTPSKRRPQTTPPLTDPSPPTDILRWRSTDIFRWSLTPHAACSR